MVLLRISYASRTTKRHRYQHAPDTTWYNHSSARRRGLWTHSQMTTGGYDGSRYHGYVAWYGRVLVQFSWRKKVCMKFSRAGSSLICWCIMVTWCFMPLIAQPLIGRSMEQKPNQFQSTSTSWKSWKPWKLAGRASDAFLAMPGPECYLLGRPGWSGLESIWSIFIHCWNVLPEGWRRLCSAKVTSSICKD